MSSSTQRVLVSYSAPQAFLLNPNWNKVFGTILAQLPLRNIHWKSASRNTVRTIQELPITLVPLESVRDELASQIPSTVLEKPLLHIYVMHCEDNDLDTYRNSLKKQIKDWHTIVTAKKNPEWLILQIVRPESRTQSRNVFQLKGTVMDRVKTDFNTDKRDRCVQVTYFSGNENPLVWAEFFNKVKEGLTYAFDNAIAQRQEEVKRSESQQQMPGWNFCTFFILKESLATSYEGMNIFEEALVQYEELESSFYHVLREKNMSWFGSLINPTRGDDSLPLLSITKKPYRDLILANTISVFDFRIYLLSRQCEVYAKMGHIPDVTRKVGGFLGALGQRLREAEAKLPRFFIESWIYSSALSVVDQCTTWQTEYGIEGVKRNLASAGKGELLDLARCQLDVIGVEVGHLSRNPPFSLSLPSNEGCRPNSPSTETISNEDLISAINDQEIFYELYISITNRAIDMYAKAGRRKFALKLHGGLAALDIQRGNLANALNTYTSLPAHYAPHLWISLESYMLSRALDTHAELGKAQDVEWIHILLSFMKAYVEHRGTEMLTAEHDRTDYLSKLVDSLKAAALKLETDVAHPDHPALTLQVVNQATLAGTRDGSYLGVAVRNYLPCTFPADEVTVVLTGRDSERIQFTSLIEGLPPGKSQLTLFCPTSTTGTFMLESSEIRAAKLLLQYVIKKTPAKQTSMSAIVVRIPPDLSALNVQVSQSSYVELGKPPSLMVTVTTGRNAISSLNLRLSAPSIVFRHREAVLDKDGGNFSFEASEVLQLRDLAKDSTVKIMVPHSDASAFTSMKVGLEANYVTIEEPNLPRLVHFSRALITTLPVSVNVEDAFRGTRLISKFTVSSTSHQYVRIASASLEAPEGLDGIRITPCSIQQGITTVTPAQPANFLFALDSLNGPVRESLTLRITYRLLREGGIKAHHTQPPFLKHLFSEVESLVENQVRLVLDESQKSQDLRCVIVEKLIRELERDPSWVDMYRITGELSLSETEIEGELGEFLIKIKKSLRDHRHPDPPEGIWREIKIPVDVPFMNIVAAACIRVISTPFATVTDSEQDIPLYAGQPISANLSIETSFHWGSTNDTNRRYILRFNIEDMVREWLVSGPKRGDFVATDNGVHVVPITLIALHHGEFTLPKVTIAALPVMGEMTMGSLAVPSIETYQVHGAKKVLVLPRGGRSTFVVGMGSEQGS